MNGCGEVTEREKCGIVFVICVFGEESEIQGLRVVLDHRRGFLSNEKSLAFDLFPSLMKLDRPHVPERLVNKGTVEKVTSPINHNELNGRTRSNTSILSQRKQMLHGQ